MILSKTLTRRWIRFSSVSNSKWTKELENRTIFLKGIDMQLPHKKSLQIISVKIILLLFLFSFQLSYGSVLAQDINAYTPPPDNSDYPVVNHRNVKNVILLIGDGMGFNQILSGRIRFVGAMNKLYMDKLPISGVQFTHADDQLITDSASSATAISSGYKTKNGLIAMTPDSMSLPTLLELSQEKNKAVGLITTVQSTHATMASFGAHIINRNMQAAIAEQYVESNIDIILGGGRSYYLPQNMPGSNRKDDRDILWEFAEAGYTVASTYEELMAAGSGKLIGLFSIDEMKSVRPEPTIEEMVRKAVEILSKDEDGFFLMVEGGQIDWGAHDNDFEYMLRELIAFDWAVKTAVEFAIQDNNTLVIVTADHETGGLILTGGGMWGEELEYNWATTGHTPTPVPVRAFGPGAEDFAGFYQNTEIGVKIANLMKIENFPRPKYKK